MVDKKEKKKKTARKPRSLHDEAVKEFFSDIDTAKSYFKQYLPAEIVKNLDFNTLRICKDSFLNKKLAKYFSDILYQATIDNFDAFIYLLIDHKSRQEYFTGFQFLKYMVRIWELYLKQNKNAKKELNKAVAQLFEKGGDIMQTIASKWKREGIKIGEKKGIKEGIKETAKRMLLKNYPLEEVINITGLTEKQVKALMN